MDILSSNLEDNTKEETNDEEMKTIEKETHVRFHYKHKIMEQYCLRNNKKNIKKPVF